MEFFRHCPGCGRRFHIKLVNKKVIELDRTTETRENVATPTGTFVSAGGPALFTVQEGRPIVIDVEEFQYAYRCKHCGHEWVEKRIVEHRETGSKSFLKQP